MINNARLPMFLLIASLLFWACTPSAPPPIADEPTVSPRVVEMPRAILANGNTLTLELALTPEEVQTGLMFRPTLAEDRGMLFVFDEERFPSFWMKNTLIALDLVFLDNTGTVVDVIAHVQPCSADPCPQFAPKQSARAVLEIAAGRAAAVDIIKGTKIEFERVPGYPVVED
ncbi:MAG: DUF192 domain-containing protein [Thermoanaerobaculales bacterium]